MLGRRQILQHAALGLLAPGQPVGMNRPAPELEGTQWINAAAPVRLKERRGKVTIVHFWTFGCINCKRNLPVYRRWHERYSMQDAVTVGVHTPEFEHEAKAANVAAQTRLLEIAYPVLPDPGHVNWRRWNQQFWPTVYLVDRRGRIRYRWEGELNYGQLDGERKMTALIETLLEETP
ncbi:MAG: redoxin domain-containing protein [Bryobacterales bacterium]|nr:redoxin domain-containing protein [Bryobacterales bacterium]